MSPSHACSRIAAALYAVAALATAGCGAASLAPLGSASTAQWIYAGGVTYHRPHYAPARAMAPQIRPALFHVPYLGGPVILQPKVYFDFWGYKKYGDPNRVEPLLIGYAKVMGGSGHNNIETQYYQETGSTKTYIGNPAGQFGGSWFDTAAVPKVPTDPQIAAEALKAVAHFGYDSNGVYFVATPPGHSEANFPAHWCAYHSATIQKKKTVAYVYFPYMPEGGPSCGASIVKPPAGESAADEGVTIIAGHEIGEAITDPTPSTAWDGPGGEIADVCAFNHVANDKFGKKKYTMQEMVSDVDDSCVQSYP
ncbi:MAG: hypothetical protein WB609_11465 [Candidatus Cybelea sp.]